MCLQGRKEFFAGLLLGICSVAAHAQPGFDERADEPGPDSALMVGSVAIMQAAGVMRRITGRAGGQRAQSLRREQLRLYRVDNLCAFLPFKSASGRPPTAKIWLGRSAASTAPG